MTEPIKTMSMGGMIVYTRAWGTWAEKEMAEQATHIKNLEESLGTQAEDALMAIQKKKIADLP